jgi:hypothetical protein
MANQTAPGPHSRPATRNENITRHGEVPECAISSKRQHIITGISGLVVEYIVAIDVTRVRFPADAFCASLRKPTQHLLCEFYTYRRVLLQNWHESGVATAISGLAA